jgi:hypothetical protein
MKHLDSLEPLDRRSLIALLSGLTITIVACDSDSPTDSTRREDIMGEITANHGHVARLGGPQVSAGQAVTISIRGGADHDHEVAFTDDEIQRLRGGERVTKGSTNQQGHQHAIVFN